MNPDFTVVRIKNPDINEVSCASDIPDIIRGNLTVRNIITSHLDIMVIHGARLTLSNVTITSRAKISVNNATVRMENCHLTNAQVSLKVKSAVIIENSSLEDSEDEDIIQSSSSSLDIIGSRILNSARWGIRLRNSSDCNVSDTVIDGNIEGGIRANSGSTVNIDGNVSGHNHGIGIVISEGSTLYYNGEPAIEGEIAPVKVGGLQPSSLSNQDDLTLVNEEYSYCLKYE
jgi:hypothetical protein